MLVAFPMSRSKTSSLFRSVNRASQLRIKNNNNITNKNKSSFLSSIMKSGSSRGSYAKSVGGGSDADQRAIEFIKANAVRLNDKHAPGAKDFDRIIQAVGNAEVVMIGEASHGTHEFYFHRAEITKRLILEKGFNMIALEADWPDAYRINRYVKGIPDGTQDKNAIEALDEFKRFPRWMWRNTVMVDFIEWLRRHNDTIQDYNKKVGIYGIDLYSLTSSQEAVLEYLNKVDPEAAKRVREDYGCFDQYGSRSSSYSYAMGYGFSEGCEKQVLDALKLIMQRAADYMSKDPGVIAEDRLFYAQQNAIIVKNAEEYYRKMMYGRGTTWNLRDKHMAEMLQALMEHYTRDGVKVKAVVWEHNSHLGDARATYKAQREQWNVGQLVRERWGLEHTFNIGFTTYHGHVTAAYEWGDPPHHMKVKNGLPGSYEKLFHDVIDSRGHSYDYSLVFRSNDPQVSISKDLNNALSPPPERLERAIGVIYRPMTERQSHYFEANMPKQFDSLIHIDK
eukprot:GEZU01011393.1.p1 GENE.GEZU01011393.1~~GEZU01011393.1.p1  ORF type:complete len:506 (-),score=129.48 GEZU01011393.1:90-1607(-)